MTSPGSNGGEQSFESTFGSVRDARASLARFGLDEDLAHRAQLVVSELATNAVMHSGAPFLLRVTQDQRCLRIEVEDASGTLPLEMEAGAMSGRGLRIVEALASHWGAERRGEGKVVWAELTGPPPWAGPPPGSLQLP